LFHHLGGVKGEKIKKVEGHGAVWSSLIGKVERDKQNNQVRGSLLDQWGEKKKMEIKQIGEVTKYR